MRYFQDMRYPAYRSLIRLPGRAGTLRPATVVAASVVAASVVAASIRRRRRRGLLAALASWLLLLLAAATLARTTGATLGKPKPALTREPALTRAPAREPDSSDEEEERLLELGRQGK